MVFGASSVEALPARAPEAMRPIRTLTALVNPFSGSVGSGAIDAFRAKLDAAGVTGDVRAVERDWPEAVRAAANANPDAIAVLGGDGTARCAAETLAPDAPPLMLLPGGTMNMLPKALYGALYWSDALDAALQRGVVRTVRGAEADRRAFFVAGIFGTAALAQPAREAARRGDLGAALSRARRALSRAFRVKIAARMATRRFANAEAIGVLAPALNALEGDRLEVAAVNAESLLEGARIGLRAVFGGWRDDPATVVADAEWVDLLSSRPIPAVLDGEAELFGRTVRIRVRRDAVRVIALPDVP